MHQNPSWEDYFARCLRNLHEQKLSVFKLRGCYSRTLTRKLENNPLLFRITLQIWTPSLHQLPDNVLCCGKNEPTWRQRREMTVHRMSILSCPLALQLSQQLCHIGSLHPPGMIMHLPLEIQLTLSPTNTYIFLADVDFLSNKFPWFWMK
jgi:hypothetical protein